MRVPLMPALLLLATACTSATGPDGPGGTTPPVLAGDVTILFVGNSLTYTNDLPGVVEAVGAAAGIDVGAGAVALPNFALEDHWARGIAEVIREVRPDVVVMQQGPSSLPANQANLAQWADSIAGVAREVGARPALLMVWPSLDRYFAFDDVREAYRAAAAGAGGTFIPAGEALRALYDHHPGQNPFGGDGFHPTSTGTVAAAYVVAGTLLEVGTLGLPREMAGQGGSPTVQLSEDQARVLQTVADSVVSSWREGPGA